MEMIAVPRYTCTFNIQLMSSHNNKKCVYIYDWTMSALKNLGNFEEYNHGKIKPFYIKNNILKSSF